MSVPKIILHVGAHKTATTYLQARLSKSANPLRQMQVGYVDLLTFREAQVVAGGLRRSEPRYAILSHRLLRRALSELIQHQISFGARRILLSDENILGHLSDLSTNQRFYPNAAARVRAMTDALRDWDVEIALSVRDYATFLPSSWGHMVLRDGYQAFDPRMADPLLNDGRGWADLVQGIRDAVPDVPLNVWAYEDFSHAEPAILDMLLGTGVSSVLEPIHWQALVGLSAAAIEQIERLIEPGIPLSVPRIHDIARQFCKSKGYRRYQPFPADIVSSLSARYSSELTRICRISGVERIQTGAMQAAA